MASGTVKWFNPSKGYGFIQPSDGGKDVFVHITAVQRAGLDTLREGQKISYDMTTERGKTVATNLKVGVSSNSPFGLDAPPPRPGPAAFFFGKRSGPRGNERRVTAEHGFAHALDQLLPRPSDDVVHRRTAREQVGGAGVKIG